MQIGAQVKFIGNTKSVRRGQIGVVTKVFSDGSGYRVRIDGVDGYAARKCDVIEVLDVADPYDVSISDLPERAA